MLILKNDISVVIILVNNSVTANRTENSPDV